MLIIKLLAHDFLLVTSVTQLHEVIVSLQMPYRISQRCWRCRLYIVMLSTCELNLLLPSDVHSGYQANCKRDLHDLVWCVQYL